MAQEPFPVRTCTVFFPFTSVSGFSVYNPVLLFPSFLMARVSEMTPEDRQVAWSNERADASAKTGAMQDGAEVVERIAVESLTKKNVYAAVLHGAT